MDLPDSGYHYSVIDYASSCAWATNGAVITISPGVVIAGFCTPSFGTAYALMVDRGTKLRVQGTSSQPCEFVWFNSVQEQSGTAWQGAVGAHLVSSAFFGPAAATEINLRFCEFSTLGNASVNLFEQDGYDSTALPVVIRDSQFHGGAVYLAVNQFNSTNCILDRSGTWVDLDLSDGAAKVNLRNWLISGAYLQAWGLTTNQFSIRDSVFYQSILDNSGGAWDHGWNAYQTNGCTNCNVLAGNVGTNYIGTVSFVSGPLGNYYLPTNSALVDLGSISNAATVGFYHFTTSTNQVLEATNRLDIGWHYIATVSSSSTSALDSDQDGIPNYLEDINSNWIFDAGETDWNTYNSTYGIGTGAGLVVFTPLK